MSVLAATTTIAALLIASPSASDADRVAAKGGFLVGNAHRCRVQDARVVRAGKMVHDLIAAAAQGSKEQEDATKRFAEFFVVSAYPDPGQDQPMASCRIVDNELAKLEQHPLAKNPSPEHSSTIASSDTAASRIDLAAGE
ncbi:MAG TPA: hypothetical protein VHY35_05010 [Stellaceae bacterium]|jgi:hypothetical protein|nr:hypothetical protein [Stellaceae bacterium]